MTGPDVIASLSKTAAGICAEDDINRYSVSGCRIADIGSVSVN